MTGNEAMQHGYCDGIAESVNDVLEMAHVGPHEIIEYEASWLDTFIAFLLNPIVNGILLLIILGGIYFEFQHPGIGFPIIAAASAAVLYFAPLYVDGLAEHWEILLFVSGLILVAIEIFVIPGFGVPGVLGIFFVIAGLTLALIRNINLDFSLSNPTDMMMALVRVVLPLGLSFFLFLAFGKNIFGSRVMKGFVLTDTQAHTSSYHDSRKKMHAMLHKTGIAITTLRPSGQIEIDGERYDAMADSGLVARGETVKVIDVSGNTLVVRKEA
jgi:membrane-bound serine protease (ClpP class)